MNHTERGFLPCSLWREGPLAKTVSAVQLEAETQDHLGGNTGACLEAAMEGPRMGDNQLCTLQMCVDLQHLSQASADGTSSVFSLAVAILKSFLKMSIEQYMEISQSLAHARSRMRGAMK